MAKDKKYKWANPHEWLLEHIQDASTDYLKSVIRSIIRNLDADDIQDAFQLEMDADGYFDEVR